MRARLVGAWVVALVALAGCGGDGGGGAGEGASAPLRVSAAASLRSALTAFGDLQRPRPSFSFAGSDQLAAQIRAGARPDVYAAANAALPAALFREGRVERPVAFARNRLVIAVRPGPGAVRGLADLARPGLTVAVGAPSVPVGAYTAKVLDALDPGQARAIRANVRSREPDVAGVSAKVAAGAVDAGFVYVSDVRAARGRLRAIELPPGLGPPVTYAAAVVRGAPHAARARAFVAALRGPAGRRALQDAGLTPTP